ncbi:DUF2306 domain-containing protein [Haloarchaeobius sp. HME9146]|uniref:DUF2306 domain-containing protein n=1 Tax=Haloarchaeobius sp. HME9146 TaxID=2978732 RepID=UPI0021BF7D18|nr:DUF2306 domain-containing protein [Haloarchaeobius sp. HME9146]MCT9094846.1 DUF2306 domain-containing protein [Haloarchaeobius sp. HME9146]
MNTIESAVLGVHIFAGFVALVTGAGAIVTEKGGRRHRRLGRTYVYGMAVVSTTALVLLAIEQSVGRIFLGLVAIFSFYFAYSGYRVLSRKRPADRAETEDWIAVALLGLAGIGLVAMGGWFYLEGEAFAIVMFVFGAIASVVAAQDVQRFRSETAEPREWFFEHLQRMGAAYIATVTAFGTVNFTFLPTIARWLAPTLVGGIAIWYTARQYRQQFGTERPVSAD